MKEVVTKNGGNSAEDWHFSGLDCDSVEMLAKSVCVPKEQILGSVERAIVGIDGSLAETIDTENWFYQQVRLKQELIKVRSKILIVGENP